MGFRTRVQLPPGPLFEESEAVVPWAFFEFRTQCDPVTDISREMAIIKL